MRGLWIRNIHLRSGHMLSGGVLHRCNGGCTLDTIRYEVAGEVEVAEGVDNAASEDAVNPRWRDRCR